MKDRNLEKSALRGEASYIWRDGQQRRLDMIATAAGERRLQGDILDNGCGVGLYVDRLRSYNGQVFGLEYDFPRARQARSRSKLIVSAAGEGLPYPDNSFDLILSHEVIEHVQDDSIAIREMVRVLRPKGRLALFCPNRGYPFETHGIYWRSEYRFGNIPLVNYLPRRWRTKLAPHVRVYTRKDLNNIFVGLPVQIIKHIIIFGAYDNIIARWPSFGRTLRAALQFLEHTPLRIFGLSHFWVVEKL
jgi:SAM-dependent methyltransferase